MIAWTLNLSIEAKAEVLASIWPSEHQQKEFNGPVDIHINGFELGLQTTEKRYWSSYSMSSRILRASSHLVISSEKKAKRKCYSILVLPRTENLSF